ncbi:hypothetical protein Trydic_g18997 [Trypoxylus dichotomus]
MGNKASSSMNICTSTLFFHHRVCVFSLCKSSHAKQIDIVLNQTSRIATRCMKSVQINKLYKAAGFVEPGDRRNRIQYVEKFKQTFDERHVLYSQEQQRENPNPGKNFLHCVILEPPDNYPINTSSSAGSNLESRHGEH